MAKNKNLFSIVKLGNKLEFLLQFNRYFAFALELLKLFLLLIMKLRYMNFLLLFFSSCSIVLQDTQNLLSANICLHMESVLPKDYTETASCIL